MRRIIQYYSIINDLTINDSTINEKYSFYAGSDVLCLQAQGISSNNRIDLSGQWRFSQGDAPTYEDVVKLPGSMLTNGKGNDVCTHTQWTGSLYPCRW